MPVSRVTFSSNVLILEQNIKKAQADYNTAAIPATTGLRLNSLSDDTTQIARLFSLRSLVSSNEQYQKNISNTNRTLEFVDSRISQGSDVLERIRDIAIRANDPSVSSIQRQQLSDQILSLKDEFLSHANAKIDNRYVFAGTKYDTQPFSGSPTTFNGNSTSTNNQVTSTLQMTTSLDGQSLFMGNVATATASDLATTLKDSDGVNLGLANGDTITVGGTIGGAFSTTINVTGSMTLSDIASSLQTAIRANGAGTETVAVQGDGSLRITAGATQIDDLTMSISGNTAFNTAFTFPTTIAAAGTGDSDTLQAGTGENIFDMIDDIAAAVAAGDADDIGVHMGRLDLSLNQLVVGRGTIGSRMQQIESIGFALSDDNIKFITDISNIQDANIDEVLTKLVTKETALRVVFESASRILSATANLQLNT